MVGLRVMLGDIILAGDAKNNCIGGWLMGIQRGYDAIVRRNQKEEEERRRRANWVPSLFLPVSGKARIRILSEPVTYNAHRIYDKATGKISYRYCSVDDNTDELCKYCNAGLMSSRCFMFWIYTYFRLQPAPGQYGDWEPVNYQGKRVYRQIVGKPMVLRRGTGKGNSTFDKFASAYLEYGTWTDRDYTWSRNDATVWTDTDYFLIPRDPSEMPEELKRIAKALPNLEDIAVGKEIKMPIFDDSGNVVKQESNSGVTTSIGTEGMLADTVEREDPMSIEEEDEDVEDVEDIANTTF
jgi:hypothetical protein